MSTDELKEAVRRFVIAEYAFRHGPYAFTPVVESTYVQAHDALIVAAAGTADLVDAAERLGVNVKAHRREMERRRTAGVVNPVDDQRSALPRVRLREKEVIKDKRADKYGAGAGLFGS